MKLFSPCILVLLLTAATGAAVASESVSLSMVAVQASNESRGAKFFGPGLDTVKRAIRSLNYDTYTRITSTDTSIPFHKETKLYIDEQYTLHLKPVSIDDQGRVRMQARLTMKREGQPEPINALETTLTMAQDKHLNLGGLKLKKGDLIVVLSVR